VPVLGDDAHAAMCRGFTKLADCNAYLLGARRRSDPD
jgi:hypothetical protein